MIYCIENPDSKNIITVCFLSGDKYFVYENNEETILDLKRAIIKEIKNISECWIDLLHLYDIDHKSNTLITDDLYLINIKHKIYLFVHNKFDSDDAHYILNSISDKGVLDISCDLSSDLEKQLDIIAEILRTNGANDESNPKPIIELSLNFIRIPLLSLVSTLDVNTTLKKIWINDSCLGYNEFVSLSNCLKVNTTLQSLFLIDTKSFSDTGAKLLSMSLKVNTTLKELFLDNNMIGNEGIKDISDAMKNNKSITSLYLSYNIFDDEGFSFLINSLKENNTLQKLGIQTIQSKQGITDISAKSLALLLCINSTLSELYLSENKIGDMGAIELAKALYTNTTLKKLTLSYNQIGDVGAIELAKALYTNTTLKKLTLSYNQIGDMSAIEFSKTFKKNVIINEFYLDGNNIGDIGINALQQAIEENVELHLINEEDENYDSYDDFL